MLPIDCLHLLTIDFEHANIAVRDACAFCGDEQRELLAAAGRGGIPLLLLRSSSSLHLVSTSLSHVRAFRPALARVHQRTHTVEGARTVPVSVARGSDAGRQLVRHALPSSQQRFETQQFVADLRAAARLSADCGAFSSELAAVCQMVEQTSQRVHDETGLGRQGALEAECELEALVGERIVEEELLAWQSSQPILRASMRAPLSEHDIELFGAEEAPSMVRLKAARVLTRLRLA